MTNYKLLYSEIEMKLKSTPLGIFRLADLIDNPPAKLGRDFRDAVVLKNRYPNIKRVGADRRSVIYEKF